MYFVGCYLKCLINTKFLRRDSLEVIEGFLRFQCKVIKKSKYLSENMYRSKKHLCTLLDQVEQGGTKLFVITKDWLKFLLLNIVSRTQTLGSIKHK